MTLLLLQKKSADDENCNCVNSAAEERLFPSCVSTPLKTIANPKALAKSVFRGSSLKHAPSLKPSELSGSTSVNPEVSLSTGHRAKATFPWASLCVLP